MARTNYGSFVFIARHATIATFNTLIPYHMFSKYRAALVVTHHLHHWLNGDVYISNRNHLCKKPGTKAGKWAWTWPEAWKVFSESYWDFFLSWPLNLIVFSLQNSIDDHRGPSDRWQARISCQILIDWMYCDTYSEEETCLPAYGPHTNCGRDKVRPQLEWESRK